MTTPSTTAAPPTGTAAASTTSSATTTTEATTVTATPTATETVPTDIQDVINQGPRGCNRGDAVSDWTCNGKDHADAARKQALAEVEQTLTFRWRDAWKDWSGLVDRGAPVDTCSIAWGRQAEALDAAEVVAAMRGPGGVESLRRHLWDDLNAGGV